MILKNKKVIKNGDKVKWKSLKEEIKHKNIGLAHL